MVIRMTNFFCKKFTLGVSLGICLGLGLLVCSAAVGAVDAVDADLSKSDALKILKRTADFMEEHVQFSTTATVWEDVVTDNGTKLQSTRIVELKLRSPNKFRADVYTTQLNQTYAHDGKMMTIVNHEAKVYGEFTAPGTIRETLDVIQERRGIDIPLEDLLLKRPFYNAAESAIAGQYIGTANIFGKKSHHLAFQHENVDWQLWIQTGPVPILMKIVINYKTEQFSPQMSVTFDKWDFITNLPDYVFDVTLSSDYEQFNVRNLETTK